MELRLKLVSDPEQLKRESQPISLKDGKLLVPRLFEFLARNPAGYFLSANQVGVDFRVGVLNVRKPLYFINPRIIKSAVSIKTVESSLSFPNKIVLTERFKIIAVDADNFEKTMIFGSDLPEIQTTDSIVLEAIMLQALIDSMNGITMYDKLCTSGAQFNQEPLNNRVTIQKHGNEKIILKKKLNRFLVNGWAVKSKI